MFLDVSCANNRLETFTGQLQFAFTCTPKKYIFKFLKMIEHLSK